MTRDLSVGVTATKASWSAELRAYLRDHTQGVTVDVIMDRQQLARSAARIDVLVVDDVMRLLNAGDIELAAGAGVRVVGVHDALDGLGHDYLAALGIDRVHDASAPVQELATWLLQMGRRNRLVLDMSERAQYPDGGADERQHRNKQRAALSVWTKVTGGCGLSEAVVAAAHHMARTAQVLVIELDAVAPVLVSRLLRSPDTGLNWALSRTAQGRNVFPGALCGARDDGVSPLGAFDVVCAGSSPSQAVSWAHFQRLLSEAEDRYDHILVEGGCLPGPPSQRERSAPAVPLLQKADHIVVLASSDPEGAARLVEWRAFTTAASVDAPCWAAFGRASASRFERAHLANIVEDNTAASPFSGLSFLPEDAIVQRARWNGEMVWKGPWLKAVHALVTASAAPLVRSAK